MWINKYLSSIGNIEPVSGAIVHKDEEIYSARESTSLLDLLIKQINIFYVSQTRFCGSKLMKEEKLVERRKKKILAMISLC